MTDRAREACEHCGLPVRDDNGPVELDGKRHDWMRCGLRLSAQLAAALAATASAEAEARREALEEAAKECDAERMADEKREERYERSGVPREVRRAIDLGMRASGSAACARRIRSLAPTAAAAPAAPVPEAEARYGEAVVELVAAVEAMSATFSHSYVKTLGQRRTIDRMVKAVCALPADLLAAARGGKT